MKRKLMEKGFIKWEVMGVRWMGVRCGGKGVGGEHVKPSTANTGSRIVFMVKYLHKRRVNFQITS
jgi:hypothetical protein